MSETSTPPSWMKRATQSARFGHFTKWIVLAALVGVAGGLVGWLFHGITDLLKHYAFFVPTGLTGEDASGGRAWLVVLLPALGGLAVGFLVETFAPEAEGHGTDAVIRSFHRLKGRVRFRVIPIKAIASAITIGTGGSAGQEGPIAQVGSGLGSTLAQKLGLSDRDRRLFLLSGASAGIGAMFGSPLGGALFMPEVLYKKPEFEGEAIVPCIIASIFGYTTFSTITGRERVIDIDAALLEQLSFEPRHLIIYLGLGIVCALVGWLFVRCFYGTASVFGWMKKVPRTYRPAIGGLLLGLLALALAPYGQGHGVMFGGYGLIDGAIHGELAFGALIALALGKILATSLSVSSGGSGGVFAPALAIGALVGALIGQLANQAFPGLGIQPGAFALVGMGGFFAGVAKVPVASVVMVTEMTGGYALLAPLLLVAVVHILISSRWTLYQAQVGSPVQSPAHVGDFVIDVLQSVRVADVLSEVRTPRMIHEEVTLRGAMKIVADSHETHFPVVDDQEKLVGIFSLTDLRRIFLEDVVGDMIIVRDFMNEGVVTVKLTDSLHDVQRIMTRRGVSAVPVVDAEDDHKVIALLERNALGRAYGEKLAQMRQQS
ncbi:MAG: CIC family chloride channel protein [Planctomycetota bacterium]|jgi:CIC family chloride channel protein